MVFGCDMFWVDGLDNVFEFIVSWSSDTHYIYYFKLDDEYVSIFSSGDFTLCERSCKQYFCLLCYSSVVHIAMSLPLDSVARLCHLELCTYADNCVKVYEERGGSNEIS
mmetsp:Transcript_22273/g.28577  ORF Transcript_22273/g.28577 Transcript_22273/m.28577 type:complete len:109 (-) Transcript_22273:3440-3766(-)